MFNLYNLFSVATRRMHCYSDVMKESRINIFTVRIDNCTDNFNLKLVVNMFL